MAWPPPHPNNIEFNSTREKHRLKKVSGIVVWKSWEGYAQDVSGVAALFEWAA